MGSLYLTISDLLGSRLAPPSLSVGRPVCGIQIHEGGSFGGYGTKPQFSLDARGKAPVVEGEDSEAHMADYLRSLREAPVSGVPPSGPGIFSRISLPVFPTHLPYLDFTEHKSYQIHYAPTPEAITFLGRADDEAFFFFLHPFVLNIHVFGLSSILFLSQVVYVHMGELHTLYSQAWYGYAFMTLAVSNPISYDWSYRRALQAWASGAPSGGSESNQSNPFMAQVPLVVVLLAIHLVCVPEIRPIVPLMQRAWRAGADVLSSSRVFCFEKYVFIFCLCKKGCFYL